MRADQLFVRIGNLLVFVFAVFLRQISLLHDVAEQLLIGAVGNAQHIVKRCAGVPCTSAKCVIVGGGVAAPAAVRAASG
jgi:hypothetical protein